MNYRIGALICLSFVMGIFFPATSPALEVELLVRGISEPSQAIGLLLGENGTEKRPATSLEPLGQSGAIVRFRFSEQDIAQNKMATAMVSNAAGEVAYATVTELRRELANPALLSLQACAAQTSGNAIGGGSEHLAMFERLVELRESRRDIKRRTIEALMNDKLLAQIKKLEAGFGFQYETPIDPEMNPVALSQRLDQLLHTIRAFRLAKAKAAASK